MRSSSSVVSADVVDIWRPLPRGSMLPTTLAAARSVGGGPIVPAAYAVQPCARKAPNRCTETMTTIAHPNTAAAALSDHPFLSSIPIGSLRRLATHVQSHTYPAGEQVFREGQIANRFFLIRHGLVRLDLEVAGRGQVEVETLGSDCALGWSWLFSQYRWQL